MTSNYDGEIFREFLPSMRYHLVDIPRIDNDKLKQLNNALAGIFLLERNHSPEEFEKVYEEAVDLFDGVGNDELWKSIARWVARYLKREYPEKQDLIEELDFDKRNRKEMSDMLETMPKKLVEYGKAEQKKAIAVRMIKLGKDDTLISECTGLSVPEIGELRKQFSTT